MIAAIVWHPEQSFKLNFVINTDFLSFYHAYFFAFKDENSDANTKFGFTPLSKALEIRYCAEG
ncbi:hypothetical protein I6M54_10830 [Shewanella algae]|uniref:Uncharacterized protein n=1 Tax=Shewanella algae TaxID=38313 RepID=A0AAD1K955_9GAMM|nr:hypothetical protein [Shewanella algae]MBO2595333.1 hypothetical protein [Shewanella algae]MBO2666686.1 hypothetical protein [Shewanella algae]BCV45156.1 hypothetical protein TUM17379_21740 [Shewanella algae]